MQAAMRPQVGIQRMQPRPVGGTVSTATYGMLSRGPGQGVAKPGPTVQGGYAAQGTAVAGSSITAPVYQPAQQRLGVQGSLQLPVSYSAATMPRAPLGVQQPAMQQPVMQQPAMQQPAMRPAFPTNATMAASAAPMPAMPATPTRPTPQPSAAASLMPATPLRASPQPSPSASLMAPAPVRTVPAASPGMRIAPTPMQRVGSALPAQPMVATPAVRRAAASEKISGVVGQSAAPLLQRNVASPAPLQRPVTDGLPTVTRSAAIAPQQLNIFQDGQLKPPKPSDVYESPSKPLPQVSEPPAGLTQPLPPQQVPTVLAEAAAPEVPLATVGLDIDHDGIADINITGVDANQDGIPDVLQPEMNVDQLAGQEGSKGEPALYTWDQWDQAPDIVAPVLPAYSAGPGGGFSWHFVSAHPMVTDEEKIFVAESLQELNVDIERFGGLQQYTWSNYPDHVREDTPIEEHLQLSFLGCLQERTRNGAETLLIQIGSGFAMGMKKVVKIEAQLQELEGESVQAAILWDWDVKLEPRGSHADE